MAITAGDSRVFTVEGEPVCVFQGKTNTPGKGGKTGTVVASDGRYVVTSEGNRVFYFMAVDKTLSYVTHLKFPHPVEDVFVVYNTVDSEPRLLLQPKLALEELIEAQDDVEQHVMLKSEVARMEEDGEDDEEDGEMDMEANNDAEDGDDDPQLESDEGDLGGDE